MGEGIRRRPLGIWMIVGMQLLVAGINLLDVLFGTNLADTSLQRMAENDEAVKVTLAIWAFLVIVASLWLLSLRRRGWAMMMLLVGLSILAHIAIWWNTPQDTAWTRFALAVLTAFYLNSSGVRSLFEQKHEVSRITIGGRPEA